MKDKSLKNIFTNYNSCGGRSIKIYTNNEILQATYSLLLPNTTRNNQGVVTHEAKSVSLKKKN